MGDGCDRCVHAWAAGLFDGEGCITLYSHKTAQGNRSWRVTLRVMIRRWEPVERLQALYGGLLTSSVKVKGTYPLWILQGKGPIAHTLMLWMPFLVEKKSQALVALEFLEFLGARHANGVYSKADQVRCERWERKMKDLKHR